MKHYPHHIGDFDRATRHLTRIERSVYRDMIELYYDTERPLPLDVAWTRRKVLAHTDDESTAVDQALNEFFIETPGGWWHERCEEELGKYRANNSQRAQAGKASAAKRATAKQLAINGIPTSVATPVQRADNDAPTNQSTNQPINHKPGGEGSGSDEAVDNSDHPPTISDEFKVALNSRPDLNADTVWANFWHHYAEGKRTVPRWIKWVQSEHAGAAPSPANDPDTKANVEALAASKGLQPWDQMTETWAVYKARVRAAQELKPPESRTKWMQKHTVKGPANVA